MSLLRNATFLAVGALLLAVSTTFNPTVVKAQGGCAALLSSSPNGGAALAAEVQRLVVSSEDPTGMAQAVAACAAQANKKQAQAMGQGLARAAEALPNTNPGHADQIATIVADAGNYALEAGYNSITAMTTSPGGFSGPTVGTLSVQSSGGGGGGGTVSSN